MALLTIRELVQNNEELSFLVGVDMLFVCNNRLYVAERDVFNHACRYRIVSPSNTPATDYVLLVKTYPNANKTKTAVVIGNSGDVTHKVEKIPSSQLSILEKLRGLVPVGDVSFF